MRHSDHVAIRAQADGGVGEREQASGLIPPGEHLGEAAFMLGTLDVRAGGATPA